MEPVSLVFLWHMHQPYYKNLSTGEYLLPWVLLHGTKDYLDMALILEEFPGLKQNFNVVPSLLLQLFDYLEGDARDVYLGVFRKKPRELTAEDKVFMLTNFFNANWENMIRPFPRYYELLKKRGFYYPKEAVGTIKDYFSDDELRDIQVLFFLAWIDPVFYRRYDELKALRTKGMFFSEEDKVVVERIQGKILDGIVPLYGELARNGTIELSTSPFYHPIVPLLVDSDVAREAMPGCGLPKRPFRRPEDGLTQIRRGKELFARVFGYEPGGMWPPEGSVSDGALELYLKEGVGWLVTDEDILFRSLRIEPRAGGDGRLPFPEQLYRPFRFEREGRGINLLFRDKQLSDLISFHYSKADPKEAATDLVRRIKGAGESVRGKVTKPVVTIAMDGENAWEHYRNDGWDFLRFFYDALLREPQIRTTTVSEYLAGGEPPAPLYHIFAGSWIDHNFSIWIGHPEDNQGWTLLGEARELLEQEDPGRSNEKAWESIYIAEGSDWFWWYGDEHTSENDEIFDLLFRENLANVYRFLGKRPPDHLSIPVIIEDREVRPAREPANFLQPVIDGRVTNYFEWLGAGFIEGKGHGVAMHESLSVIRGLHYGFDQERLFLRVDLDKTFISGVTGLSFEASLTGRREIKVICEAGGAGCETLVELEDGSRRASEKQALAAFAETFEMGVPFAAVDGRPGEKVQVWVVVKTQGMELDRIPKKGYLSLSVPKETFEMEMWYV